MGKVGGVRGNIGGKSCGRIRGRRGVEGWVGREGCV